jgi:glycosyltransferase involved in cell wall biosynthesis
MSNYAAEGEPIYFEVSSLLNKKLTGIGRYVARMVEALARRRPLRLVTTIQLEQARSINLLTCFTCGQEIRLTPADVPPADEDVGRWVHRLLHRPSGLHDWEESRQHPGIYTMLRPPGRQFRRELCLLYDFTPILLPWTHLEGTREHYGIFFSHSSGWCDRGVAISESTRADARWLCALPAEHIAVGYPGPSLCVYGHCNQGPVKRRANVLLVVSTLEPRKNSRFLFDWFLDTNVLPAGMELWWVGPTGWLVHQTRAHRHKGHGRSIKFLGMVSDRRLCELYQEATCSVYPSLYEGFGLPVLDSLRHGTPVLSSLNSSLQEFAGPGVFFFDPYDPASLDQAYRQMEASRPTVIDREVLEKRFSWDALADTVLRLCA